MVRDYRHSETELLDNRNDDDYFVDCDFKGQNDSAATPAKDIDKIIGFVCRESTRLNVERGKAKDEPDSCPSVFNRSLPASI